MSCGRSFRIEDDSHVSRPFLFEYIQQSICKAKDGRGILSLRINTMIIAEGEVGPVNESHCIEQEEFFV
jgi:hypothetical protein